MGDPNTPPGVLTPTPAARFHRQSAALFSKTPTDATRNHGRIIRGELAGMRDASSHASEGRGRRPLIGLRDRCAKELF